MVPSGTADLPAWEGRGGLLLGLPVSGTPAGTHTLQIAHPGVSIPDWGSQARRRREHRVPPLFQQIPRCQVSLVSDRAHWNERTRLPVASRGPWAGCLGLLVAVGGCARPPQHSSGPTPLCLGSALEGQHQCLLAPSVGWVGQWVALTEEGTKEQEGMASLC